MRNNLWNLLNMIHTGGKNSCAEISQSFLSQKTVRLIGQIWFILVLDKIQEGRKVKQLNLSLFDNNKFLHMFHMNKHKLYNII